ENHMVEWLLQQGVNVAAADRVGDTPADDAELRGHNKLATYIREHTAVAATITPVAAQITSRLRSALARGDNEWVAALRLGVPILTVAAHEGYLDLVSALLEANANIEYRGDFRVAPLAKAVASGHTLIVEKLLSYGADVHASST
ncbi:unnamed protein product, partial [Meganyctiphanes norvegica]